MALKSTLKSSAVTKTAEIVSLPQVRANGKSSTLVSRIDKVCKAFQASVNAIRDNEVEVQKILIACIEHFEAHGDANPADRLVKGLLLINHPSSTATAREVMAHFRNNSPIRWESKSPYKLFVLKEGMEGYKAPDVAKATEVSFNETPQAMRARAIGQAAQNQALKDADLPMMLKRAAGVVTFFNNLRTGADARKIKTGEEAKMEKFAKSVNQLLKDMGGDTAVVAIAKPTQKKAA